MKTIGVITTSRADYGLYLPILNAIRAKKEFKLKLYVSGMHLSKDYGSTLKDIERGGFNIVAKVKMTLSGEPKDIGRAMGEVTQGFSDVFSKDRPDILLVLGDRYEMHAAALAAIAFGIPLAHIHGGELTFGAFDEYFRHSLTKLSHLHFATTKAYANRIVQMGEEPWRVFAVGSPGVEGLMQQPVMSKEALTKQFGVDFSKPILLVTFHPVTMEGKDTAAHIRVLLSELARYKDHHIVFTRPNSDTGNHIILKAINQFVKTHSNAILVQAFGHAGHTSMMHYAQVMIGNSSSGIIEAASFKLPVVNIGSRQEGRIRARNVIDVGYAPSQIQAGIKKALSQSFKTSLKGLKNPYGDGKASKRIVSVLSGMDFKRLRIKRFHDMGKA